MSQYSTNNKVIFENNSCEIIYQNSFDLFNIIDRLNSDPLITEIELLFAAAVDKTDIELITKLIVTNKYITSFNIRSYGIDINIDTILEALKNSNVTKLTFLSEFILSTNMIVDLMKNNKTITSLSFYGTSESTYKAINEILKFTTTLQELFVNDLHFMTSDKAVALADGIVQNNSLRKISFNMESKDIEVNEQSIINNKCIKLIMTAIKNNDGINEISFETDDDINMRLFIDKLLENKRIKKLNFKMWNDTYEWQQYITNELCKLITETTTITDLNLDIFNYDQRITKIIFDAISNNKSIVNLKWTNFIKFIDNINELTNFINKLNRAINIYIDYLTNIHDVKNQIKINSDPECDNKLINIARKSNIDLTMNKIDY